MSTKDYSFPIHSFSLPTILPLPLPLPSKGERERERWEGGRVKGTKKEGKGPT